MNNYHETLETEDGKEIINVEYGTGEISFLLGTVKRARPSGMRLG